MKKIVLTLIVMVTLCIHSATLEEARQVIREYLDESAEGKYRDSHHQSSSKQYQQALSAWRAIDRDLKMSVYLGMIKENDDDLVFVCRMLGLCSRDDGRDFTSYGNQEALDWARKVLRSEEAFNKGTAVGYLLRKGDARDVDIIGGDVGYLIDDAEIFDAIGDNAELLDIIRRNPEFLDMVKREKNYDTFYNDCKTLLAMRVAGTNIINYVQYPGGFWERGWYCCIPSVTNTGPQGLYVENILRQYWENMEAETFTFEDGSRPFSFKDRSKIPAEIQTLVVWFDDDGNPVCNVDLAKYGLTMPEIDLPQNVRDEILRRARSNVATASLPSADDTPPNRLWLYTALLAILCATAALWLIRKKR